MEKFNAKFKIGTLVKVNGRGEWFTIKSIHESRHWIQINELEGSFQRSNVFRFTNKLAKLTK